MIGGWLTAFAPPLPPDPPVPVPVVAGFLPPRPESSRVAPSYAAGRAPW